MKSSAQSNKGSLCNLKTKKSLKEKEKRKLPGNVLEVNSYSISEKGSPIKEPILGLYAGIDADSIINYAEQTVVEHLSDEITNTLTEDLNYRLRYIINDSLLKARLSGRNAVNSRDLERAFNNLRIDKVFGTPTDPNWISFSDQNLYCLKDGLVNLVEIAEQENVYYQYSEPIFILKWVPEQREISTPLKSYFNTICQMIVMNDTKVRRMVLKQLSESCEIGRITEWFYNFGYILLSKDITYDCLTLRALDLIAVLENSPICRINVSERQLRLLVRLILQRLLKSTTTDEILKPMCNTLARLCRRTPLRQFVITKILQKIDEVFQNYAFPIIAVVNILGTDAIQNILLPNLNLFLKRVIEKQELPFIYSLLESYYILCKNKLLDSTIYECFSEYFGDALIIFNQEVNTVNFPSKKDTHFARVKCVLLRTRRKVDPRKKIGAVKINEVFEMPPVTSKIGKIVNPEWETTSRTKNRHIVVGKISLLLPVFKQKAKLFPKCQNHTMLQYNL